MRDAAVEAASLSNHEGHVLALVWRWQPTTAYFLSKALTQSIASDVSNSPGSLYPVVERLKKAGLVTAELSGIPKRKTELLRCTEAGLEAIRSWMLRIEPSALLPSDPWRMRAAFLGALSASDAQSWLLGIRAALAEESERLERARSAVLDLPSQIELTHARLVTAARIAWANEALILLQSPRLPDPA